MTPEDQYPSTNDCATRIREGDDPVALCLLNSRARVAKAHTTSVYAFRAMGEVVQVCAVGAVYVEGGVEPAELGSSNGAALYQHIESQLRDEAKTAIALLNEAAIKLVPESAGSEEWQGPLEWVNQDWAPESAYRTEWEEHESEWKSIVRAKVLEIYDLALHDRVRAVA